MAKFINRNLLYRSKIITSIKRSRIFLLCFCIFFSLASAFSQCNIPITHTKGDRVIGCTKISVTSLGFADTMRTYCNATTPYFIGANRITSLCGDGSYTFAFSPPIKSATLNFSGISDGVGTREEIKLKLNGFHYKIPTVGSNNGCDPLGVLTIDGNVGPCNNCVVSGWNGTTITGNISTLTVIDTVLNGQPAGALFSLFICNNPIDTADTKIDTVICSGQNLILNPGLKGAVYQWQDNSTSSFYNTQSEGIYWVKSDLNGCDRTDTINVKIVECDFDIPNIFTPNEDGINDAWRFEIKNATDVKYSVYNRWGNLIKDSSITSQTVISWDGRTTAGEACSAGVYYYVLTYTDAKGDAQKKNGYITLVK
jgi:gliding motility-associated-like protein